MTEFIMWWPSPEYFSDLTITDTEEGMELAAPEGTLISEWIQYWGQTEEHREFFEKEFIKALVNHVKKLEENGKTKAVPNRGQNDSESTENECPGSQP